MNEEHFLIQYIPSKNCLLQFSNKWFQKINGSKCTCLKLIHPVTKEQLHFTWAPQPSSVVNDCSVGINATFAQGINLNENELVVITSEENLMSLRYVYVTPLSADDFEILEVSRESVELSLLNQIRVVYVKQIVSIWVSKTINLKLAVDRLNPEVPYGKLEQNTELVIENMARIAGSADEDNCNINSLPNHSSLAQQDDHKPESSFWGFLSNYMPDGMANFLKRKEDQSQYTGARMSQKFDTLLCRVHPFPHENQESDCCNHAHNETIQPFNIFINRSTLERKKCSSESTLISSLLEEEQSVVLCRMEAIAKKKFQTKKSADIENNQENDRENKQVISIVVRLYRIAQSCKFFNKKTSVPCVYVSKFLRTLLGLAVGSKVRFSAYNPPLSKTLTGVTLVPGKKLNEGETEVIREQFSKRLSSRDGVLINNHCPFLIPHADGSVCTVLVRLSPTDLVCWPLTQPELQVCHVAVSAEVEKNLDTLVFDEEEQNKCQKSCVFKQLVDEGITTLEFGLRLVEADYQYMVLDNILITGQQGSGKSRLAEAIYTAVSGPPHHVYVSILDCKQLKGKTPDAIDRAVTEHVENCIYYQPAVLVLEDLSCLVTAPKNGMEPSQESAYFLRVATVLKELLWRIQVNQCVIVIATAESRAQIHPQLVSARGRHSFVTFLHIPPLHKEDRLQILSELLEAKLPSAELPALEELAGKTEGYVAQDLRKLVDKMLFKACQRQAQVLNTELQVTAGDVEAAHHGFVPSALVNVSLVRNSPHTFACIGGLQQAKQVLTEVLIWPTKYPEVFSQCPLRLDRGVLLYGAPGTGKTQLANAVAGESGLNFITVKGPELLSKYIGASEEAVRNIFQKAHSAQPCILFFDEFESLAPRRGHDSTGVTDRVVNQLLTQLDGVEALEGVWVLAAANRPDLIDPALLRPGRIGTLVHCPVPDQAERLDILQSSCSELQLSDDVDLSVLAAQTNGYTGADLQAILFTAQMISYESSHQGFEDELEVLTTPIVNVQVSQSNLLSALQDTAPSLKQEDRFRFEEIYDRFQKSPDQDEIIETSSKSNQRVTLA